MDQQNILKLTLDYIAENSMVTDATYNMFKKDIQIRDITENPTTIYLEAPVLISRITNKQYLSILEESFKIITGKDCKIVIKSSDEYRNTPITPISTVGSISSTASTKKSVAYNITSTNPDFAKEKIFNPVFTFKNFIAGDINKYSFAACEAVATSPFVSYNPLYIHGQSGLGKTHLINAIGTYILEHSENLRIIYVSSETFMNEYIRAVKDASYDAFREKYRKADVLLIDDIQFLEKKEQIQTEFFHTFNTLYEDNKQIILTSDKPPIKLKELDERLRNRFGSNMVVEIKAPDYETRVAILEKKAENRSITLTDSVKAVIRLIAENMKGNVRELQAAFYQILDFSQILNEEITIEFANRILKDRLINNKNTITPEKIKHAVCNHFKLKITELESKSRKKNISDPRQIAMYLCRIITNYSYVQIGNIFNRDYTTVMDACKKIERNMETDDNLKNTIDILRKEIEKN